MSIARFSVLAAALASSLCFFTACSGRYIAVEEIRRDPSPRLHGVANTFDEFENNRAIAWDVNLRQVNDDWERFWLSEHPMRLTHFPRPH